MELPHFPGRNAARRPHCNDLRTLLEPVVALDAGGARGGVGAHVTQRVDAVESLDTPNRLPVNRAFRLGAVLGFELLPGPALERVGQSLVLRQVPFAQRAVVVKASVILARVLAHELEELGGQRHVSGFVYVSFRCAAEPVSLQLVHNALGVDGARAGGEPRDDLRHVEGLDLDQPLLSEVHQVPGHGANRAEKEHGDHRDAPPQTDAYVARVTEHRTASRAAAVQAEPARQDGAKPGFARVFFHQEHGSPHCSRIMRLCRLKIG